MGILLGHQLTLQHFSSIEGFVLPFKGRTLAMMYLVLLILSWCSTCASFSSSSCNLIFGIKAGWTSPDWSWGSPVGTAHDCAKICRHTFCDREAREELVNSLIYADTVTEICTFEEIKLILALMWQRARKVDPSMEAYGQILDEMTKGKRYEEGTDDEIRSRLLVQDMQKRYMWLNPDVEDKIAMNMLWYETEDYDVARRRCSGLILKSMGFVDDGM